MAPEALLDTAVARAAELAATLDPAAYRATVRKFRGPVLDTMATQIAATEQPAWRLGSPSSRRWRSAARRSRRLPEHRSMQHEHHNMEYRRLGRTGIKLSVLSFGSWVTFDNQLDDDLALECMQAAHDAGCNFFDNAEAYAGGKSEAIMGRVLPRARMAAVLVRAHDQGVLGHPRRTCRT